MHHGGSHWIHFRQIWSWGLLWRSVEKIQIWLKSDKNFGQFVLRPKHLLFLPATLYHRTSALLLWSGIRLPSACIGATTIGRIDVEFDIGDFYRNLTIRNLFKLGRTVGHFTWRHKYSLLLLAILYRHVNGLLVFKFVDYVIVLLCILIFMYVLFCVFCFTVLFCVLFVCECVLYYCHRVTAQLQLTKYVV